LMWSSETHLGTSGSRIVLLYPSAFFNRLAAMEATRVEDAIHTEVLRRRSYD
jgi:hypothetical protein